jgi:hypothetical protein
MSKKFEPSKLSSPKQEGEVAHQVRQAAALKQLFEHLESHLQKPDSEPLPRWVNEKVKRVASDSSLILAYLSALDRRKTK